MDARIVRTRRRLQEALFALARERGVDEISVSDIATHAGINRSTFYQHYSDKETLLADALDLVAEQAGAQISGIDLASEAPPAVLVTFLEHIDQHGDLYRRVFSEPGYGAVIARLRGHMVDAILSVATAHGAPPDEVPPEAAAAGMTGLVLGVVGHWLSLDPRPSAADAADWIWRIVPTPDWAATRP